MPPRPMTSNHGLWPRQRAAGLQVFTSDLVLLPEHRRRCQTQYPAKPLAPSKLYCSPPVFLQLFAAEPPAGWEGITRHSQISAGQLPLTSGRLPGPPSARPARLDWAAQPGKLPAAASAAV